MTARAPRDFENDPVWTALENAPADDRELGDDERAAVALARAELEAGEPVYSTDEILATIEARRLAEG